jgi:hypothetical protein
VVALAEFGDRGVTDTFNTRSGASPPSTRRLAPFSVRVIPQGCPPQIASPVKEIPSVETRPDERIRAFAGFHPVKPGRKSHEH